MSTTLNLRRRRRYHGEDDWFPILDELGPEQLRAGFIDNGVRPAIAGNLVWFLSDQRTLRRHLNKGSRTRYRTILADLSPVDVLRSGRAARAA